MFNNWDHVIVTHINMVTYVAPSPIKAIHKNRPFHGLVINDATADKIIHFSDGTAMRTGPNELHYLPKGSNYQVEVVVAGGCWAINFDLLDEMDEKPFNVKFRSHEAVLNLFQDAVAAWNEKEDLIIRKSVYDIIIKIKKELQRGYIPSGKEQLIQPAVDRINRDFTKNDLSVNDLAALCGISKAYFRRIFIEKFSLSPKEYIISLRLERARHLLESGQFSVSDIALMCGYFEPCHFSREFKKRYDLSPVEYVKATRT